MIMRFEPHKSQPKPKLSLFNHEKRIAQLEKGGESKLIGVIRTYGAICGFFAYIILLIMWIVPSLR